MSLHNIFLNNKNDMDDIAKHPIVYKDNNILNIYIVLLLPLLGTTCMQYNLKDIIIKYEKIMNILVTNNIISKIKDGLGILYKPDRTKTARMNLMLSELKLSSDSLWKLVENV